MNFSYTGHVKSLQVQLNAKNLSKDFHQNATNLRNTRTQNRLALVLKAEFVFIQNTSN